MHLRGANRRKKIEDDRISKGVKLAGLRTRRVHKGREKKKKKKKAGILIYLFVYV